MAKKLKAKAIAKEAREEGESVETERAEYKAGRRMRGKAKKK